MKKMNLVNLTVMSFLGFSIVADAASARTTTHRRTEESSIEYSQSATESTYSTSKGLRVGLGFSTVQNSLPGSTAALTGIFDFDRSNMLQAFFSIPSTSPFNIAGVVLYKRTIAESRGAGFHLGGGFGLASVNDGGVAGANFAMNVAAVAGFHFELPGVPHVNVHLDGGPSFNLINTSPSTYTNFQVGALSPALGASVMYIF